VEGQTGEGAPRGSFERARAALASGDFRYLLAARWLSQTADGFFQAYLVAQLVFLNPEKRGTVTGIANAYALLVIPFSIVGPLTGILIDRWSRRRILWVTPLIRFAALLLLLPSDSTRLVVYAPALVVVSLNRFYLATAGAVTPSVVRERNLLVANSLASVGGTVATFGGIVAGTKLVDAVGPRGLLAIVAVCWPVASLMALRIGSPLRAPLPQAELRRQLRVLANEFRAGAKRLKETPAAVGSVASISLDQFLIGFVTVLSLVVFKERFKEGVGSYGNIIAAGGLGVLAGTLTVGWFEPRLAKPRIVSLAFALSGVTLLSIAPAVAGPTILLASFVLGLTFAWRKIPIDTIVQESIPDRFRGRVFAIYDLMYSMARVVAAAVAIPLIPNVSVAWLLAGTGAISLLWVPVLPWWVTRPRWVRLRFYAGGRADQVPRAVIVGGEEEPVEVVGSWIEERGGERLTRYRLRLSDGSTLDVAGPSGDRWRLERELPPASSGRPSSLPEV
jgi:MFS family permease